jgi:hypothetical protein
MLRQPSDYHALATLRAKLALTTTRALREYVLRITCSARRLAAIYLLAIGTSVFDFEGHWGH